MKSGKIIISSIIIILSLSYCSQYQQKDNSQSQETVDSMVSLPASSLAAVQQNKHAERQFLKTADVKCRVQDVVKATYDIEGIVARQGGFITYTNLQSDVASKQEVPVSRDSVKEVSTIHIHNSLVFRVPAAHLDSTLKAIADSIDFLDYRIIKADDMQFAFLEKDLTIKRKMRYNDRVTKALAQKANPVKDMSVVEEMLLKRGQEADETYVNTRSLDDQVAFSTVNLEVYQREQTAIVKLAKPATIIPYEPAFGEKLQSSFLAGAKVFSVLIIVLTRMWGVLLLCFAAWLLYNTYRKKLVLIPGSK